MLACCTPAATASAQVAYSYALIVGPTATVDGLTPSSLNDSAEVVYADNANGTISTSSETLAQVDDIIGGERLLAIPAGSETSLNDGGLAVFEAHYDAGAGVNLPAIFTPTDLVAKHFGSVGGWRIESPASPAINASGRIVFTANICPDECVASAIFLDGIEQKRTPFSDGFHEVTSVSHTLINDDDLMGFYGRAYLANHAAVYVFRSGQSAFRVVRDGVTVAPGVVLGVPGGAFQGFDLNEQADVAASWTTDTGKWLVVKNEELVAMAGDTIGGIVLTELSGHRPALNDEGVVVFMARHAGGDGVFTQTDMVLTSGQIIGGHTVQFIIAVAINDSGAIAAQVFFEDGFDGIVLATPLASNRFVRMRAGSAVALRQQVDVPSDPFAMRVDHRFATTTGELQVRLGGSLLDSVGAPGLVAEDATRGVFEVNGEILGNPDVTLELELDGVSGSTLEVDNIFFPGLVNGSFEAADLSDWETVTSGDGSVELVPEPSALLAGLACILSLGALAFRSSGQSRPGMF